MKQPLRYAQLTDPLRTAVLRAGRMLASQETGLAAGPQHADYAGLLAVHRNDVVNLLAALVEADSDDQLTVEEVGAPTDSGMLCLMLRNAHHDVAQFWVTGGLEGLEVQTA